MEDGAFPNHKVTERKETRIEENRGRP